MAPQSGCGAPVFLLPVVCRPAPSSAANPGPGDSSRFRTSAPICAVRRGARVVEAPWVAVAVRFVPALPNRGDWIDAAGKLIAFAEDPSLRHWAPCVADTSLMPCPSSLVDPVQPPSCRRTRMVTWWSSRRRATTRSIALISALTRFLDRWAPAGQGDRGHPSTLVTGALRRASSLRIPEQSDHRFRRKLITHSGGNRSPIPAQTDQ